MSDQVSSFDLHRKQLASGLAAVAKSMRNCAELADAFAKVVADTEYSPVNSAVLQDASESGKGKRKAAHSPEEGEAPKKRRRPTKPRDPNAPKRPASSYILFQNEVRKELKERHPKLSNSDLMGLISEQWKNMAQEQKETYNQLMKTAKAQYSEDKKAYDNRTQAEGEAGTALQKEGTNPVAIKPASSAKVPGTSVLRPPAKANAASLSSNSSDDQESEEEPSRNKVKKTQESDSSEEEEEEEQPALQPKRRGGSTQPTVHKAKQSSKV